MSPRSKHLSTFVTSFGLTESHSDVQFLIRALLIRKYKSYFFTVQLKLENLVNSNCSRIYVIFHSTDQIWIRNSIILLSKGYARISCSHLASRSLADLRRLLTFSDKISKNLNNPFCTKQLSTNGKIKAFIIIDFSVEYIKFLISLNLIDILIYLWFNNYFEMICWTLVWQRIYSLSAIDWFGSRFFGITFYQMT